MEERYAFNRGYIDENANNRNDGIRNTVKRTHKVTLTGRKTMLLTGINDVMSFDANEVLLDTELGTLMVRGSELHISRLNLEKGEADIDGRVDGMIYSDSNSSSKQSGGVFSKLFK